MGRVRLAMFAALAVLAAACSDPSAIGRAVEAGDAPLGPTVLAEPDDAVSGITPAAPITPVPTEPLPTTPPLPTLPPSPDPVTVLAVGNLGRCTADSNQVVEAIAADDGLIFAAGDLLVDERGAAAGDCSLDVLEGQLDRVYAVPGDRDLAADDGEAFYELLSRTPTDSTPGEGWFVTSMGGWQVIGLNSRCDDVGGCGVDSVQYQWLDSLLREESAECRAVIWHDARFTSTDLEDDADDMGAITGRLDGAGTDVVITGSPGNYERLGPLRPNGQMIAGDQIGIRHFNIGGGSGAGFDFPLQRGTRVREDTTNGYVRFVFSPEGYTWEFVATSAGDAAPDIGSGTC